MNVVESGSENFDEELREACVGLYGKTRRLLCGELFRELSGEEQKSYAERSVQIATERKVPG